MRAIERERSKWLSRIAGSGRWYILHQRMSELNTDF